VPDHLIEHDRRVADVETAFDPANGNFNGLFATAVPLYIELHDGTDFPPIKQPRGSSFWVRNIFTDFKRHDVGPGFYEREYDGTMRKEFMTTPLWGVGSTSPYGHDGRSINLTEVILRHGGEAQAQAAAFEELPDHDKNNLNTGNRSDPNFPQSGHGSIQLSVLFNDPGDLE
jgi:hypothetical protein